MRAAGKMFTTGKLISVLLALVLVAAACGGDDEPSPAPATPAPTAAPTQAPATPTEAPSTPTEAPTTPTPAPTAAPTQAPPPPRARGMETLTVAIGQNPVTLDSQLLTQSFVRQIIAVVFDPLVWTFAVDGETVVQGGLAERWESNADATEWTFWLKEGVTFHDGTPFNAAAVQANFDRIQDPDLDAALARGNLGPYDHTEIIDDLTVKVVFSAPNALFLDALSTRGLFIGAPSGFASGNQALNPIGSGAYIFEEFQDRQFVRVSRNPDWTWGPPMLDGVAGPEEIVFRILEDGTAHFNAVQTGEIDVAQQGPMTAQNMGALVDGGDYTRYPYFNRGTPYSWIFNMESDKVSDVRVRQAISHAIDKPRLISTVLGGVWDEATSVFSASTPGYLPVNSYPYDPTRAAVLLDDAGWVLVGDIRMKDGVPLELEWYTMNDFPVYGQMAPFVQAQLFDLGIKVNITAQSWPGIGETLTTGVHDVAITSLNSSSATAAYNAIMSCASDARQGGFNWSFFCDPEIDALMNAAAADPVAASRIAKWEEASQKIIDQAPYIPMVENAASLVARNELSGFMFGGVDGTPIYSGVVGG